MNRPLMRQMIIALFFLVAIGSNASSVSAYTVEETLTALEKTYGGKSFQAHFEQTSTLAALEITETASGRVWFSHPGKMKWQYLTPERHAIFTNGEDLWIFRPEENQAMHGSAERFFTTGAGGAFLSDISLVRKNYIPTIKTITSDRLILVLIAKRPSPEVSSIELGVTLKDHQIVQVKTLNQHGDTTLFDFSQVKFKSVDPVIYEFQPPKAVTVIEME